jgi:hypothetical protein
LASWGAPGFAVDDDADRLWPSHGAVAATKARTSRAVLDTAVKNGTPAVKLAARMARAYVGHAEEMAEFLRVLRDGA